MKAIQIGILGDAHVGKTFIFNAISKNDFDSDYISTVGLDKLICKKIYFKKW